MAAVERNVYDERTMSVLVTGEEGTNEAETFLQDKLCEQGLKGTRDAAARCQDARRRSERGRLQSRALRALLAHR